MFTTATLLVALALGAPAPGKTKSEWLGQKVFFREQSVTFIERVDGEERPSNPLGYLTLTVVDEDKDHVAVSQDGVKYWVKKADAMLTKKAAEYFEGRMEQDSPSTWERTSYCWSLISLKQHDRAFKAIEKAINDQPGVFVYQVYRARIYINKKEYQNAVDELTAVLKDNPGYPYAHSERCFALIKLKKFKEANDDIDESLKTKQSYWMLAHKARILSTAADAKIRNGEKALEFAKKAEEMMKGPSGYVYQVLASSYAELGQFDKAIEYQQKSLDYLLADDDEDEEKIARAKLKLYRDKKPFRDE
jgi:tetratricopeptide (TPR) repeat protein